MDYTALTEAPTADPATAVPVRIIERVEPVTLITLDSAAILQACAPLVLQWAAIMAARKADGRRGAAFQPLDEWVRDLVRGSVDDPGAVLDWAERHGVER